MIVSNFPGGSDVFALPLDGSKEMTGDLKLGGNQIKNIGAPEDETDAARKQEITNHNKSEDAHANILSDMVKATGGGTMTMGESIGAGPYTIEMTEEEEGDLSATQVGYNNVATGMAATNVQDAVTELFTSVSNGKSLLAGAITDKGVSTSATDSFAVMATNIGAIETGGGTPASVSVNYGGVGAPMMFIVNSEGNYEIKDIDSNFQVEVTAPCIAAFSGGSSLQEGFGISGDCTEIHRYGDRFLAEYLYLVLISGNCTISV